MGDSRLIIGGSLLFAGCAADPPVAPSLDAAEPTDAASIVDAGEPDDAGFRRDTGHVDAALQRDAAAADFGLPPSDAGAPEDAGAPPPPPRNGQLCDQRGLAYCARNQAQFWCTGSHWQRTDNYRCDACAGPTGYRAATCHQPDGNIPCDHPNQAWCSAERDALMICMGERWNQAEAVGFCGTCELDGDGYLVSYCAVPGFVGLAKAGRRRRPGQSLRPQ